MRGSPGRKTRRVPRRPRDGRPYGTRSRRTRWGALPSGRSGGALGGPNVRSPGRGERPGPRVVLPRFVPRPAGRRGGRGGGRGGGRSGGAPGGGGAPGPRFFSPGSPPPAPPGGGTAG